MKILTSIFLSLMYFSVLAQTQPPTHNLPEPETLLLLGLGAAAMLAIRKFRK